MMGTVFKELTFPRGIRNLFFLHFIPGVSVGSIVLGWKSNISSLLRSLGGNVKNQGTGQKKISPRKFYLGQLQQFEMKNQIVSFSVYSNLKIVYNAARFILFIQSRKPLLVQDEKLSWNRKGIITFFASHYPFFCLSYLYLTSLSSPFYLSSKWS